MYIQCPTAKGRFFSIESLTKKVLSATLLFVGVAISNSCKKHSNIATPATKMNFTVKNLNDITVTQYRDTTIYIVPHVSVDSGQADFLTITPDIATRISFAPSYLGGMPPFEGTLTMRVRMISSGVYPLKFTAVSHSGITKTYTINIYVQPNASCSDALTGIFNVSTVATPSLGWSVIYSDTVTAADSANIIMIPTLYGKVRAHVSCLNNTLFTDALHTGQYIISQGSGTYDFDHITINYAITDSLNVVHSVVTHLLR